MTTPTFVDLMLSAPKRIGLLLGAGASRPLGLPIMTDLLPEDYRESLAVEVRPAYDMALNWALSQGDGKPDFELLYTAVDAYTTLESEDLAAVPFARHHEERGFVFKDRTNLIADVDWIRKTALVLREDLKAEVHNRVGTVDPNAALNLYKPVFDWLFSFAEGVREVLCFTTNYDRAIEEIWQSGLHDQISVRPKLVRGFSQIDPNRGLEFDPKSYAAFSLDGPDFVVKLYKLHGSLNWIRQGDSVIESPANEYLRRNVLIYPLRKHDFEEPFSTLFSLMDAELKQLSLLVVIGSSLRDAHIRASLETAMRADSRFKVVIIDPKARAITASFGSEFDESLLPGECDFGTPEAEEELRNRLMEAATYGTI